MGTAPDTVRRITVPDIREKLWGYEVVFANHELYCGKALHVLPNGNACSLHFHRKKHETFCVEYGVLNLQVLDPRSGSFRADELKAYIMEPGSSIVVPPMWAHRFWVDKEVCRFIEISTQDFADDSIRLVKSGPSPETLTSLEQYEFNVE